MTERLRRQEGDRVAAILSATDEEVQFLGYGTYQGMQPLELPSGLMLSLLPEEAQYSWEDARAYFQKEKTWDEETIESVLRMVNPKILLDSGEVIYGCECWWGNIEKVEKQLENRKVINILPSEAGNTVAARLKKLEQAKTD